jgi:hypothetical protein
MKKHEARKRIAAPLVALLLPAVLGTGCVRLHGPEDVRKDLSRSAGVKLDREMGFTVTRSGVWMARKILKWSGEDAGFPLKGVRRVEIGIYEVRGLRDGFERQASLRASDFPGWTPLVAVYDDGENALVMTQERDGQIRKLLVVAAEEDEWVLVRISGKLDQVLESAIRMAFDETDRPEMYDRTREERGLPPLDSETESEWGVEHPGELACYEPDDPWVDPAGAPTCEAPPAADALDVPGESPTVTLAWAD